MSLSLQESEALFVRMLDGEMDDAEIKATLIEMAEKRPGSLDQMMGITGVGAKKLESYGAIFLEVITGASPDDSHPARRKLAGRPEGELFDRLMETQAQLSRGADGTGKYLTVDPPALRRIAEARPRSRDQLARYLDPARAERFGAAFMDILAAG